MLKRILLPSILILLGYGFWVSPDFKEIAAGVAVFLFGMFFLEEGFRAFTGGTLELILRRCTNKLWKSISFGIVTTTIMQSSSLVSVITISFLSASLISLASGLGIIFGANIGTTTGAWLVAGFGLKVKISAYAMPMLVFGCILYFQKNKSLKGIGYILAGLGFLFLGIHHMKEGFTTIKDSLDLVKYAVPGMAGLFFFTAIGVFATVVMQSSHATLVIIITALAAEQITYENALALAIGANIGTTITAILGAMGASVDGKRLAGGHLIFNAVTAIIAIVAMPALVIAVDRTSAFLGIRADDYTLKLAVFHTIFNVIGVVVMIPLMGWLVRFLMRTMKEVETTGIEPQYLNDAVIEFPDTILRAMRLEILHLYDNGFEILTHGINLHRHDIVSTCDLQELIQSNRKVMDIDIDDHYTTNVKALYAAIVHFTSQAQEKITEEHAEELHALRNSGQHVVEAVKGIKHLNKNLNKYLLSSNPHISKEYDDIRYRLALMLRDISSLRGEEGRTVPLALSFLDTIKARQEEADVIGSGRLDDLIRKGQITAEMGTSLMNDIAYMEEVLYDLLRLAEILFRPWNDSEREAEEAFALTDEERKTVWHHHVPLDD